MRVFHEWNDFVNGKPPKQMRGNSRAYAGAHRESTPQTEDDGQVGTFEVHDSMLATSALLPRRRWIGGEGGFTPSTVSAISGPPKVFKSTLALSWAISLAAGIEWGGLRPERPYKVLYVA